MSGGARRTAVYDRYWRSQGGGERHAGMLAQVLAEDGHAVDLLGHEETDLDALGDHLGLDLSGCRFRLLPDRGDGHLAEVSADYDLLVNATYMSRLAPRSRRAAYLCFFPTPPDHDLDPLRQRVGRLVGPHLSASLDNVDHGLGWYPPEGGRRRRWSWTSGDAVLSVPAVTTDGALRLVLDLGRPGAPEGTELRLVADDGHGGQDEVAVLPVAPGFERHELELPARLGGTELRLLSGTFSPVDTDPASPDRRALGVAVSRMHLVGAHPGVRQRLAGRFPWALRAAATRDLGWLDGYDLVMANSAYTAGYVEQEWRRAAPVLYPPVQVERLLPLARPAAEREPLVVTVGRFFAPGLGHAKRQEEMVEAFGRLVVERRLPGWRMAVVGGCEPSQEPYLQRVRTAAAGLPVDVLPNAPRAEVERLLSSASVFWSATGWHSDETAQPWTAEHFGMTTVEAMAGGCVPVVIDRAGQREIVREGVDGFRWSDEEGLLDRTTAVGSDPDLRARLAASAVERASAYDEGHFRDTWHALADRFDLLG